MERMRRKLLAASCGREASGCGSAIASRLTDMKSCHPDFGSRVAGFRAVSATGGGAVRILSAGKLPFADIECGIHGIKHGSPEPQALTLFCQMLDIYYGRKPHFTVAFATFGPQRF
jgi:hypothetical protein